MQEIEMRQTISRRRHFFGAVLLRYIFRDELVLRNERALIFRNATCFLPS